MTTAEHPWRLAPRGLTLWARVAVGGFSPIRARLRTPSTSAWSTGRDRCQSHQRSGRCGRAAHCLAPVPPASWRPRPGGVALPSGCCSGWVECSPVERRHDGQTDGTNNASFTECHSALRAGRTHHDLPGGRARLRSRPAPVPHRGGSNALGAAIDGGVSRGRHRSSGSYAYQDRGRLGSDVVAHFGEPLQVDASVERGTAESARHRSSPDRHSPGATR